MSNEIQIYLDDSNNFYTPGQRINGRVICNFTEEKQIRAITVQFTGKCNTWWTETERYYDDFFKEDRTRDIDYSGEEIYFNQELNLAGGSGQNAFTLTPGRYVYNFSYQLPEQLPSTYEGLNGYGSIHYRIKANIDSPWKFDVSAIAEPVEISVDKVLCSCWCRNADALTFTFSLPCTGFVPGQDVRIGVCVQNLTNASVQEVKFKIIESTEFIAKTPRISTKLNKDVLVFNVNGGIGAHGEKSWTSVLTIPQSKHFPNLVPCNLINVRFKLKAEVVLPCPHSNLKADVPITIGHVQLTGTDLNVVLGPPQEINARVSSSSNTSLIPMSDRRNYGSIYPTAPIDHMEEQMPPSYDEVQKLQGI